MTFNKMLRKMTTARGLAKIRDESDLIRTAHTRTAFMTEVFEEFFPDIKSNSDFARLLKTYKAHQVDDLAERKKALPMLGKLVRAMFHASENSAQAIAEKNRRLNIALGREFQTVSKQVLKGTATEKAERKAQQDKALKKKREDTITLTDKKYFEVMSKLTDFSHPMDAIILVQMATGLRAIEAISGKVKFTKSKITYPDGTVILNQTGKHKDGGVDDSFNSEYKVQKPLLHITYTQFRQALKEVAKVVKPYMQDNPDKTYDEVSRHFNGRLNRRIKPFFEGITSKGGRAIATSHRLRESYANIAIISYKPEGVEANLVLSKWLGHKEGSSVVFHYRSVEIKQSETIADQKAIETKLASLTAEHKHQQAQIKALEGIPAIAEQKATPAKRPEFVLVEGKAKTRSGKSRDYKIMTNPRVKGKGLENIKKSISQYIEATGEKPKRSWIRKELGYGGSLVSQARDLGLTA